MAEMAKYLVNKQQVKEKEKGGEQKGGMSKQEIKEFIKKKFSKALASIQVT
jgi:hypothetical protein